jgi:hypothetical protein
MRAMTDPEGGARYRRLLAGVLLAGAAIRLVLAFATRGVEFDIDSFEHVRGALAIDPLQVYSLANLPDAPHWPYPPGFLPWIAASGAIESRTGLRFDGLVQLAPIAADLLIAWVVQAYLGARGATTRTRLAAASLVALGPAFFGISGFHGQIDSVAIAFGVLGLWAWEAAPPARRALLAGLAIGIGAAVKGVPLVLVLALLPSVRGPRELVTLVAAALAPLVLALAPFLVADGGAVIDALRANKGLPGFGGISLLAQPELARVWLGTGGPELSAFSRELYDAAPLIALAALAATAAVLARRRVSARHAAPVLWLAFFAFGINFNFQYLVWLLPFLLLAGRVRTVALVQGLLLVPGLVLYLPFGRDLPLEYVYVPAMLIAWAAFTWLYVRELRATGGYAETGA